MLLKSIKRIPYSTVYQLFIKYFLGTLVLSFLLMGCASQSFKPTAKLLNQEFKTPSYRPQHTGFFVLDVENNEALYNYNGDSYFIPASTTKLVTLYSALQLIDEQIPSLKYAENENGITILGTGDPTWLHPFFKNKAPLHFLKKYDSITLITQNYQEGKFGPGWAWEDYPYYFSPEKSALPLYGNVVRIIPKDSPEVSPRIMTPFVNQAENRSPREWKENNFFYNATSKDTLEIPFITSDSLTAHLLSEEIKIPIKTTQEIPKVSWKLLPSISRDSILKQMLLESDNFLAEQLMLNASSTLSDTLSFRNVRDYMLEMHLNDLKNEPRWVDGSGLSRYNLFTPRSLVTVLTKLHKETPSTLLYSLLPKWDSNGTIKDANPVTSEALPIYAKSGSMGNVYNLCGFVKTKSGRLLAFSYMNNHFRVPSSQIRAQIYQALTLLHSNN